jgi:hypothetical protein
VLHSQAVLHWLTFDCRPPNGRLLPMSQLAISPWEVQTRIVGKLALIACILLAGALFAIAALELSLVRVTSHLHGGGWHPQRLALASSVVPPALTSDAATS